MRKRTALEARLKKLEKRQLGQPLGHRIIFGIAGADAGDIVGMTDDYKIHIMRGAGETVEALERRAFEVSGAHTLFCVYRAHAAAAERPETSEWGNGASQA